MSYVSPIEIIESECRFHYENEVMTAIQNVGVNVDKEELIKALNYDRAQYTKGYKDGCDVAVAALDEFSTRVQEMVNVFRRRFEVKGG